MKQKWTQMKAEDAWAVLRIQGEFVEGFTKLRHAGPCISIFGSARTQPDEWDYKEADKLASMIVKKGYGVITGGGPGIMEAANKGAFESNGKSIGLEIRLPFESAPNDYINEHVECKYFFTRKVFFLKYAQAFVAFPGGVGTLDELFETLTLIQTGHVRKVPIVLVGTEFWKGMVEWIKTVMLKNKKISPEDLDLFHIVDTAEDALEYIMKEIKMNEENF